MLSQEIKFAAIAALNNTEEVTRCLWQHFTDERAIAHYRRTYHSATVNTSDAIADAVAITHLLLTMALGLREWLERQDHEIPVDLEAPLKPKGLQMKALPAAPSPIALLAPAKEVIEAPQPSAIPVQVPVAKKGVGELRVMCDKAEIKWRNARGAHKHLSKKAMIAALSLKSVA
jgi:hypothetical protein